MKQTYNQNGKKITARDKKKYIMRVNKWTEDEYRKKYDIFKNKLRAYESYRIAHGADVEIQSPQDVLYKQARAMAREGEEYTPSAEMKRIQSFSAVSITKGRILAQDFESVYSRRAEEKFAYTTAKQFKNFIEDVPLAAEINEKIKDPVKKEEALKALAEHVHAIQAPSGEVFEGETFGSDEASQGFDYSEWLEE